MTPCDEESAVYNGHLEVEILIDRAADEVWKHYLDLGSWVTTHRVEQLSGALDEVGGVKRISPKGFEDPKALQDLGVPSLAPPHYHYCKLMKVVPGRQYL